MKLRAASWTTSLLLVLLIGYVMRDSPWYYPVLLTVVAVQAVLLFWLAIRLSMSIKLLDYAYIELSNVASADYIANRPFRVWEKAYMEFNPIVGRSRLYRRNKSIENFWTWTLRAK
jgi:hypothetical protein